jgi:glc operon protein GlcG
MPDDGTPTATRPTLSTETARTMVDAAIAEAVAASIAVTVAIVDESGILKEMLRMDGAPLVSVQTAINKAYAAAAIGMPPDDFYAAIESDGAAVAEFATRPGLALIAGGLPVVTGGRVAGAIGVAGAMTGAEDRRIADAALVRTGER